MPGRLTLTASAKALQAAFPSVTLPDSYQPRYNIAPQSPVAVISNANPQLVDHMIWGLIPAWERGVKMTKFLINARSESVHTKRTFSTSFVRRRCLILVDGYFEWLKVSGVKKKQAYHIHMQDRRPFAFAGIWDSWQSMDGSEVISFAALTCEPNEVVKKVHHRMGVIIPPENYDLWLSPDPEAATDLRPLLKPYPPEEMTFHRVSDLAGNPRNDSPEVVTPIGEPGVV